jgi:hypothetical protein
MNDFRSYTPEFHQIILSFASCWDLNTVEYKGLIDFGMLEGFMLGLVHNNDSLRLSFSDIEVIFGRRLTNSGTKRVIQNYVKRIERNLVVYNKLNWKDSIQQHIEDRNKELYLDDSIKVHFQNYLNQFPENEFTYGAILNSYDVDYNRQIDRLAMSFDINLEPNDNDSLSLHEILKSDKLNLVYFKIENDPYNQLFEKVLGGFSINKITICQRLDFITVRGFEIGEEPSVYHYKFFNLLSLNIHEVTRSKVLFFDDEFKLIWSSKNSNYMEISVELRRLRSGL